MSGLFVDYNLNIFLSLNSELNPDANKELHRILFLIYMQNFMQVPRKHRATNTAFAYGDIKL